MSTSSSDVTGPSYSFGSTSVRETSAMPVALRSRVPAKITSSMRTPRRLLADCSPKTQEMASEILDFPHPLGPTTAAMPSPGNFSSVRSQKDLNPRICSFLSLSNFPTPSGMPNHCTALAEQMHHLAGGSPLLFIEMEQNSPFQLMYPDSNQGSSAQATICCG